MEQTQHEYAGFWMRLVAAIVDSVLIGIINLIILVPFLGLVGLTAAAQRVASGPGAGRHAISAIN